MPHSLKGWLMFGVAVLAVIYVVNHVSFLGGLVTKR